MSDLVPHQAFENLLSRSINLSQSQISQGSKSQNFLRDLLNNKEKEHPHFPWLVDGDFLSGSYARGTKIAPLNDIDVMMVLDGSGLCEIRNGLITNAEVRGARHGSPATSLHIDARGLVDSKKILEVFRDVLNETYPDSQIKKDGQAINVWLESYGLGLDIVPCFHIVPRDGSRDYYYIPTGGESTGWMSTNPKIDKELCDNLNDLHGKKMKPIIKLIKFWNETQNQGRIRSYHLEVITWRTFASEKITDYPSALRYFFNNAELQLTCLCPDPTGLGDYIDKYMSPLARQQSIAKIREARQTLNARLLLGTASLVSELSGWKKVFGQRLDQ